MIFIIFTLLYLTASLHYLFVLSLKNREVFVSKTIQYRSFPLINLVNAIGAAIKPNIAKFVLMEVNVTSLTTNKMRSQR